MSLVRRCRAEVAYVSAAEIERDASCDHRQVVGINLALDGEIVATEVRIVRCPADVPGF
jgi:hypothetical protein